MSDLMMPDVNFIIIAGRLTKDPVFRRTTNGTPVANFTIVSNRKYKDNIGQNREDVCYVGVVAWYKLAESCSENLKKNSAVIVEGELQSRSWKMENGYYKNIVEIKAHRIQFLEKKEICEASAENQSIASETEAKQEIMDESQVSASEHETPPDPEPEKQQYDFGYNNLQI
jgi:single-strand DNA-binding protein